MRVLFSCLLAQLLLLAVPRLQFECNLTELLKSTSEEHEAAHGKKAKGREILSGLLVALKIGL